MTPPLWYSVLLSVTLSTAAAGWAALACWGVSVMWSRWHRRYDTSFPADAGAADQVADIAATILSGCGLTVVTVALFLLTLWWLWR